jgi:hypothetical protein
MSETKRNTPPSKSYGQDAGKGKAETATSRRRARGVA